MNYLCFTIVLFVFTCLVQNILPRLLITFEFFTWLTQTIAKLLPKKWGWRGDSQSGLSREFASMCLWTNRVRFLYIDTGRSVLCPFWVQSLYSFNSNLAQPLTRINSTMAAATVFWDELGPHSGKWWCFTKPSITWFDLVRRGHVFRLFWLPERPSNWQHAVDFNAAN